MIIGVTGYLLAGKDSVAGYLIKKGYHHYSLSDELRSILAERGIVSNRDNQVKLGNELRAQYGSGYLAERVLKKTIQPSVITSIRNPGEIEALKKSADFRLIFIDAPLRIRYERMKTRRREGEESVTYEKFQAQEKREKSSDPNALQLHRVRRSENPRVSA